MFSFYGSKSKIVNKYPAPLHPIIIEPFAGSARYSLKYWEHDVILWEIDPKIYSIWKYLQRATSQEILDLPDVENATRLETIDGFSQLSDPEKWLIGFCCNGGSAQPKNVSGHHNFNSWNKDKIRIAKDLYKIKHWDINLGSYHSIPNIKATFFVDPPYMEKGKWYTYNRIDYKYLADWCKNRRGQVIVCENSTAGWLPFTPLVDIAFTHFKNSDDYHKKTSEAMWHKEK